MIEALNEVQIQKNTGSTLSVLWNRKSHNTCIGQVKVKSVVVEYDYIDFFDWSLNNSSAYFWSCDDILKCSVLKLAIERALEKLPHYALAHKIFNEDHGITKYQFVGFVSSYSEKNVLTAFHLESLSHSTQIQVPTLL